MRRGGVQRLGKTIPEVLELAELSRPMLLGKLSEAWKQVVGAETGARTKVQGFRHGCLHILVDSAARRWELENFHAGGLLEALREKLPKLYVKQLRFHLGAELDKEET